MGTTANALLNGDVQDIASDLDRLRSFHVLVALWSWATASALEGEALFMLGDELEAEATANSEAAARLAGRVAELGGRVAADPADLLERARIPIVDLPADPSRVSSVLGYALQHIQDVLPIYDDLAHRLRDRDVISHRLVVDLYATLATREDEIESVIGAVG